MFKYLTHNLKLGLTTLTILTAGAGAAFAQPAGFATAIDPIADCSSGGFRAPSYCTIAVVNCIHNPFGSGCATTLGTKAHTVAKVRYCGEAINRTKSACASTVAGANAAMWAKQHPDALTTPSAGNQFLKGTADGVDTAGVTIRQRGALYFDTATFDGRALGGDATDGVAFFSNIGSPHSYYAGILSGTDLGAPLTQRSGTASWVGQFQALYNRANRDFVLEVTFGGTGDVAGSIEAFVQQDNRTRSYHLKGDFDNRGLITGTVDYGGFTDNDRDNSTRTPNGTLTGLIGQEGAVGAFHRDGGWWYSGGFIARPPSALDTAFLNTTCSADPFTNKDQEFCYLEYADDRVTRINTCITGGNASGAECRTARAEHSCISNPFASNCATDFTDYYEAAQTNRIQFCLDNTTNSLCTNSDTVAAICAFAPFAAACFNGDTYKTARTNKINFCRTNTTHRSCTGVTENPNAVAWADSFVTPQNPNGLPSVPNTDTSRRNQFLKGTASGVNKGDIVSIYEASLNLNTAQFNGTNLGGDVADGVGYFRGRVTGQTTNYSYAGIFSGTDLGAPVTETSGTASWVGSFKSVGSYARDEDFILEVDFANKDIEAFIDVHFIENHYHLTGSFNDSGVINGEVFFGGFTNKDRTRRSYSWDGPLTGLIGQEGAVGVFFSESFGYVGGFVARPANATDKRYLNTTCTNDPFGPFCYLEKSKQRAKIIQCTEGSNASRADCTRAVELNPCINNPFASNCVSDFADHYITARTNRINFCNNNPTNSFCTNSSTISAICAYAPFAEICFNGNSYKSTRASKIGFCHTNTTDLSCTGVTENPNAVAWEDSFVTTQKPNGLSSVPDTTNRRHQFLKDLEDKSAGNLDSGDTVGDIVVSFSGSLNMSADTFNGRALGGDAADGVAFFHGRVNNQGTWYHYAGIFSGTDLGAPITQTSGTASWVGRFEVRNYGIATDFVLEIDFNGTGDKAGYIEAFVQRSESLHLYLDGYYDAHGLITGTVDHGAFTNNDRDNPTGRSDPGTLTGLIGKDGAVGAFISNYTGVNYAGGFVARPANTADKRHLNTTCTNDPFGYLCYLETDKQAAKIIECTQGSNASRAGCARAVELNSCLTNPFASNCVTDFAKHYETARTNRAEFCVNNLTHSLCRGTGVTAGICTYAPFASICFSGNSYNAARDNKYTFCRTNANDPSCTGVNDNPNAVAWANSFATLPTSPNTITRQNQFLKGGATALSNIGVTVTEASSLNLATATFGGNRLGGDSADGVAFFRGRHSGGLSRSYAGILSGTNLGAPVTQTRGSARWNGSFRIIHGAVLEPAIDFTLTVNFGGTGNKAGSINAFITELSGDPFYLTADFDNKGLITGRVDHSVFTNNDPTQPTSTTYSGILTGLIGQQGAVGAFYSNYPDHFSGGFVARP